MSDITEDMYARLNSILDKVTESLATISEEREKQNTHFSNLIEEVESKNSSLTDKFNKFKNSSRKSEMALSNDITDLRQEIKDNNLVLTNKITELGSQIKDIEGVLELIQRKQKESEVRISSLESKVKKRKWWKLF